MERALTTLLPDGVRQASFKDIPDMLELGREMHQLSPWRDMSFDKERLRASFKSLILAEHGSLLYNGNGMFGGLLYRPYFGSDLLAYEDFWYARSDGAKLLRGFEIWAKSKGCKGVILSSIILDDERRNVITQKMYERRGYRAKEIKWHKEL
jgi:hypothetical protein